MTHHLLRRFALTTLLIVFILVQFPISKPANAFCCVPDYQNMQASRWLNGPGEETCPNNPGYSCDIRSRTVRANLLCLSIGCVGEDTFGCRPTCESKPVVQFVNGCGSTAEVTWFWVEYEALDCDVQNCFCWCKTLAKASLQDSGCPDYVP